MSPAEPESSQAQSPTHLRQLALQSAAAIGVLSLAWPYFALRNETLPWPATALAIGGVAFLLATLTRQAWWWRVIHALFAPLVWQTTEFAIDPGWFLAAFIALLLVYRGALGSQIPLYFSNTATANALAELLEKHQGKRFIDLGAGIGSVLRPLSKARPQTLLTGVENAPGPWLLGYLRTVGLRNCNWRWGDLRRTNLADYDVVYAFLSPAPMSELWAKVQREMHPDSLFVSNSFAVPGVEPSEIIELDDSRLTRLYCYRR